MDGGREQEEQIDLVLRLVSGRLTSEDLENLLLKIEPIKYQEVVDWTESHKAIDTSQ
jgi:hypothetical protein